VVQQGGEEKEKRTNKQMIKKKTPKEKQETEREKHLFRYDTFSEGRRESERKRRQA